MQMMDLRNNHKSLTTYFIFFKNKIETWIVGSGFWFPDLWSRFYGGLFDVESDLLVPILIVELQGRKLRTYKNYKQNIPRCSLIFPLKRLYGQISKPPPVPGPSQIGLFSNVQKGLTVFREAVCLYIVFGCFFIVFLMFLLIFLWFGLF